MSSDLAFYLAKAGYDVRVVTSCLNYENAEKRFRSEESVNGVRIHRVLTTAFGRKFRVRRILDYTSFYVMASWRLWRLTRRDDVVVALTDPPLISVLCMFIAQLRGAQLVNWLQDIFPDVAGVLRLRVRGLRVGHGLIGWFATHFRNYSLRGASMNVVLCSAIVPILIKLGVKQDRISVNMAQKTMP